MSLAKIEPFVLKSTRGIASRIRIIGYRLLGLKTGTRNRLESARCRRLAQIEIGDFNSFVAGCWLWPLDADYDGIRIRIGNRNFFSRGLMIDACGYIEIGDENMFGPDIYITDSNHTFGAGLSPQTEPMRVGRVKIGSHCWIGAKAVILSDVELGDGCVVGAGAVVTKSFVAGSVIAGVPARLLNSKTKASAELQETV